MNKPIEKMDDIEMIIFLQEEYNRAQKYSEALLRAMFVLREDQIRKFHTNTVESVELKEKE